MHTAIGKVLSNSVIVGCEFHLKQAILRHCGKGGKGFKTMKGDLNEKVNRIDLLQRISSMVNASTTEEFILERQNFVNYYNSKHGYSRFLKYMENTWIGTKEKNTLFPHTLWSLCSMPNGVGIHMTNNHIESYHKEINSKFSSRPKLKRAVEILQKLEQDSYNKKKQMENFVSVRTAEISIQTLDP
jgi:hypothetical protein